MERILKCQYHNNVKCKGIDLHLMIYDDYYCHNQYNLIMSLLNNVRFIYYYLQ